jgi:hypothetical protein
LEHGTVEGGNTSAFGAESGVANRLAQFDILFVFSDKIATRFAVAHEKEFYTRH